MDPSKTGSRTKEARAADGMDNDRDERQGGGREYDRNGKRRTLEAEPTETSSGGA